MLGEEAGIKQLADVFYEVMNELPEAKEIRNMHGGDLAEIKQKLFEYLSGWLGGPALYSEKYGTICLTDPHRPYKINDSHRDQWLLCMDKALERVGASDELRTLLKEPFFALADVVKNIDD